MLIFVSWGGDTSLPVARVLHELLQSRFSNEEVFLSDRSIEPGDDPSRRILEEGLLKAEILVAVLTKDDVDRPWVIWETASVWARRKLVIPLFVDVQPRDVPGPLTTKVQGAPLSNKSKVDGVFAVIGRHLGVTAPTDLTDREYEQLVTASKGA